MSNDILRTILSNVMLSRGYDPYVGYKVLKKRWLDINKNRKTTLVQKIWAQRRGFYSDSATFYRLNEINYSEYISDFDYARLFPINGAYSKWIDDKLTLRYLLQPYSRYLPEYYYHICNGEILQLPDCLDQSQPNIASIIELLKIKGDLAAKSVFGSFGKGFYKFSYNGKDFLIDNVISSEQEITAHISQWMKTNKKGYLITEYIHAHSELKKIWDGSPNPLRIMVLRDKGQSPKIFMGYIVFGMKSTGVIEGVDALHCRVDLETGRFGDGELGLEDRMEECKYHPDSKVLVEGVIPHWDRIKEKILEISSYIPQVKYLGYDVIVTEDGFKIPEINSHQGIMMIQYYRPLLREQWVRNFFNHLREEKKAARR